MANVENIVVLLGAAVGVGAVIIGTAATVFPKSSSANYGLITENEDALAYVRATGIRDVFIGLIFLGAASLKNSHMLGFVAASTAIVAAADFLITRLKGSKKVSLIHLAATIASLVYAFVALQT